MSTSTKRYFRMSQDMLAPGRWVLTQTDVDEHGNEVNPWLFDKSKAVTLEAPPILAVSLPGNAVDYSETELATPVVSGRLAALLRRLHLENEVQLVPARVAGHHELYFILNTLKIIHCIDDARCEEVVYWSPEDDRPDRAGHYRNVAGMKIDSTKVGDANIFRPWGWTVALMISERVKNAMEAEGITGARFIEV